MQNEITSNRNLARSGIKGNGTCCGNRCILRQQFIEEQADQDAYYIGSAIHDTWKIAGVYLNIKSVNKTNFYLMLILR